jgi:hypothetical protein
MRLPRVRFTVRSVMAAVALSAVVLWMIEWAPRLTVTLIDDFIPATVRVDFRVVDDVSGEPIAVASVHIPEPRRPQPPLRATTGADGRATIRFDTWASEGHNPVGGVYRKVSYHAEVRASADGYRPVRFMMSDLAAGRPYDYEAAPPPFVIRLRRSRGGRGQSGETLRDAGSALPTEGPSPVLCESPIPD